MILVFSVPMDSSSEIHKDQKCFKEKENVYNEQRNYHLIGDQHCEKEVCLFKFPPWLSFLSHEEEINTRRNQVIIIYTGYCHWLSINVIVCLSYKKTVPDPPFTMYACFWSCPPCMPHCRRSFLVTTRPTPLKQEFSIFICLVAEPFV